MDSILNTVKKTLGMPESYTYFDTDLILHINSVFMALQQLGVGPDEGCYIEDSTTEWTDIFGDDSILLNAVQSYICLKVRMLFDPPTGGTADAFNKAIAEAEWRLNAYAESKG